MTLRFSYAFVDLGNEVVLLGDISALTTRAEKGQYASCDINLQDPSGSLDIEAFRVFIVDELACSATRIGRWYITDRSYERVPGTSLITGAARRIAVSLIDLNAVLYMKLITHSTFHYQRPEETDAARMAWLLGHVLDTIPVADNGLIDTSNPVTLSAVDYTGQFPIAVLNDMANRSGKNFYIYSDPTSGEISLAYFTSTDGSYNVSTLSISNDLADLSSTCFAPLTDATLTSDPSQVYDGVFMPYSGGEVYVRAPGRVLARDVVGPSANTSSRTRATELAQAMLDHHASESQMVTCTVKVPAAQVNLIAAGMLVNAKFIHLPGWESGLDVRVLEQSVKQDEQSDAFYNVTVRVGHPVLVNFGTGGSPDNTRQWPSQQPPYQPSSAGSFTFVQSAKTPDGNHGGTATFGATPTAGHFLVATCLVLQPGGTGTVFTGVDFGAGWTVDIFANPNADAFDARLAGIGVAHKISDGTETTVTATWTNTGGSSSSDGFVVIAEYDVGGASPEVTDLADGSYTAGTATAPIPSLNPTSASATLLVAAAAHEPNYTGSVASPWTLREESNQGGSRQCLAYLDQIIASASGSYTGTFTGGGGTDDFYWIPSIAFSITGGSPTIGQPVAPESAVGDGSQTIYTTAYPYAPGSLVVRVNGSIIVVAETDPTAGTFTLPFPPAVGALISWTYNVADPTATGASNPPPTGGTGTVPPAGGGGGTVLGGDGTFRQPSLSFIPAETPDGAIVNFTIVPYVAGTTLVYINGLIQRLTTDYSEASPGTGVITFVDAPVATDNIIVVAMPAHAVLDRPFPAPTTTATYTIPGTIDPTGATEVGALIDAWIATVPDHSVLDFAGGTFKCQQGLQLPPGRHHLYYDGTGATIEAGTGAGNDQLASQFITGHTRGGSWAAPHTSSDIVVDGFHFIGNNPTPGVFTPGTEAAANMEITAVDRIEIKNITGEQAWGDLLFVEDVTNLWMHDCHAIDAGRDGISVISGDTILAETNAFDVSGQNVYDVEPNTAAQACRSIILRDSTFDTWGNAFLGVEGSHTGAPVHGITVSGNIGTTDGLLTIASNGGVGPHMTDIAVINNTGAGTESGPVFTFGYIDNVTQTGNVQAHTGALDSFTSCTNVVH